MAVFFSDDTEDRVATRFKNPEGLLLWRPGRLLVSFECYQTIWSVSQSNSNESCSNSLSQRMSQSSFNSNRKVRSFQMIKLDKMGKKSRIQEGWLVFGKVTAEPLDRSLALLLDFLLSLSFVSVIGIVSLTWNWHQISLGAGKKLKLRWKWTKLITEPTFDLRSSAGKKNNKTKNKDPSRISSSFFLLPCFVSFTFFCQFSFFWPSLGSSSSSLSPSSSLQTSSSSRQQLHWH